MINKFGYNFAVIAMLIFSVGIINTVLNNPVMADGNTCEHMSSETERDCPQECPVSSKTEDEKCEKCRHTASRSECPHACPEPTPYRPECEKKCEKCGHMTSVPERICMSACIAHLNYHMKGKKKCEKCGQTTSDQIKDCMRKCIAHLHHHMQKRCEKCGLMPSRSEEDSRCESCKQMHCPMGEEREEKEKSEKW